MDYDKEFITTFNEFYPFERYIVKNPQSINDLFDDALLTEIFIPSSDDKVYLYDIYIKLICKGVEFRLAYYDFDYDVRTKIRGIIQEEFGNFAWQSLYTDYGNDEDYEELIDILKEQQSLITKKYKQCSIKDSWIKDDRIIELLNE